MGVTLFTEHTHVVHKLTVLGIVFFTSGVGQEGLQDVRVVLHLRFENWANLFPTMATSARVRLIANYNGG